MGMVEKPTSENRVDRAFVTAKSVYCSVSRFERAAAKMASGGLGPSIGKSAFVDIIHHIIRRTTHSLFLIDKSLYGLTGTTLC